MNSPSSSSSPTPRTDVVGLPPSPCAAVASAAVVVMDVQLGTEFNGGMAIKKKRGEVHRPIHPSIHPNDLWRPQSYIFRSA
jgi:hypothetical protein